MNQLRENVLGYTLCAPGEKGVISLAGFSDFNAQHLGCFTAVGNHFQEYGITNGSLLLVEFKVDPRDGDLVITGSISDPAVKLYKPNLTADQPATIPTVSAREEIIAVILSSFNFFS